MSLVHGIEKKNKKKKKKKLKIIKNKRYRRIYCRRYNTI